MWNSALVMMRTSIYGSENNRWIGRIFQTLRCPDDLAFGSEVTVPIDTGATGVFKVVGLFSALCGSQKERIAGSRKKKKGAEKQVPAPSGGLTTGQFPNSTA
jgi:hypothetical protein